MRQFISGALAISFIISSANSWAYNEPRKDSKWDRLHRQSSCLNTINNPLFEVKNYTPEATVTVSEGWINRKTEEPTYNPYYNDPKTGQPLSNKPAFAGLPDIKCPKKLNYRWTRDISWTRSNGEKVTVTIQRTHKCKDASPTELFTKQKVFIKTEPKNAKNLNLSSREEDALIAEGVQALEIENENRLAATSLNYSAAKVKTVGDVNRVDEQLRKYIDPGSCHGNKRTLAQETAAKKFCEARTIALKKITGPKFSERDAQCPQLVASTMAEIKTAALKPQPCGRTFVSSKGEVSYCPIPPSGFAGKVGDQADNGCKVDEITPYNVMVACPPGALPRLPEYVGATQTTTPAVTPASSAK